MKSHGCILLFLTETILANVVAYGNESWSIMTDLQIESFDLAIKHISTASRLVWSDQQRMNFINALKQQIEPDSAFALPDLKVLLEVSCEEVEFTDNFIADEYPLNATPTALFLQVFAAIAFFEVVR